MCYNYLMYRTRDKIFCVYIHTHTHPCSPSQTMFLLDIWSFKSHINDSYCESAPTPRRAAWEGRASIQDCGLCFVVIHRVGSWGEWRAGLQKFGSKAEQMCFQSPPSTSSELWMSLCVYSWPQRASVLHSSQQLAAELSQASSVCWSPLHHDPSHSHDL